MWCKHRAAAGQGSAKGWRKTSPPGASHSNIFSGGRVTAGGGGAGSTACILLHPAGRSDGPMPPGHPVWPPAEEMPAGSPRPCTQRDCERGLRTAGGGGSGIRISTEPASPPRVGTWRGGGGLQHTPWGVKPQVPRRPLQIAGFSDSNRLQKARGTRGDRRAGALLLWSQLSEPGCSARRGEGSGASSERPPAPNGGCRRDGEGLCWGVWG